MNTIKRNNIMKNAIAICALLLGGTHGFSQGFMNLDFESANIPPGTPAGTIVSPSAGLPGWYVSAQVLYYDDASLGGAFISIDDAGGPVPPLEGDYSMLLFGGPDGPSAISQTGLVPANAQSILMDVAVYPSALFTVTLGGQTISMSPVLVLPNYTVYGGNVSAEAGQVEALTITQFDVPPPQVPPSELELDNIIFSPNPIPEPETWSLLLCGAGLLVVIRRFRKS